MKNKERRLRWILRLFEDDAFYSCTIDSGLQLQGYLNRKTISTALKLKFEQAKINSEGYVEFNRGMYHICLT